MTAPPKRRWFRFSLRTMFALVTIFGIWLGWQVRIVQGRKSVIEDLRQAEKKFRFTASADYLGLEPNEHDNHGVLMKFIRPELYDSVRVSWVRRCFGDETCIELGVPIEVGPTLISRMERAFPEAFLEVIEDGRVAHFRDSLYKPASERKTNVGTIFKTGLIEK